MFREDSRRFYKELGKKTIHIEKPPDTGEVKKCSGRIYWSRRSDTMRMPNGSRTRRKNCSKSTRWSGRTSQLKNLRVNMTRAANWKSPGPDRLPNFWDQTVQEPSQVHGRSTLRNHQEPKANSRLASRRSHQPTT